MRYRAKKIPCRLLMLHLNLYGNFGKKLIKNIEIIIYNSVKRVINALFYFLENVIFNSSLEWHIIFVCIKRIICFAKCQGYIEREKLPKYC